MRNRKPKLTRNRKPLHKITRKPGIYFEGRYYKDRWDVCKYNERNEIRYEYALRLRNGHKKCLCGCDGKNKYGLYGSGLHKSNRYKRYIKQRNRKKYNLKQLDKYNKPKLINHCINCVNTGTGGMGVLDSRGFFYQKCYFCC